MVKKLVIRVLLILVTLPFVYYGLYRALYDGHHYVRTKNEPNAIYMMGDSRMVHGLSLEMLALGTQKRVHSYGTHGSSVYSLLAMSEMVPAGATVIMAPSLGMLMRPRALVSYESGISAGAMWTMLKLGYDWWYFEKILAVNRYPFAAPHRASSHEPYPINAAPNPARLRFEQVYANRVIPPNFESNKLLLKAALETLLAKGCRVELVVLPVTDELEALERTSVYGKLVDEVPYLRDMENVHVYSDIQLRKAPGENLYFDLDHLNGLGRYRMTVWFLQNVFDVKAPDHDPAQPELQVQPLPQQ